MKRYVKEGTSWDFFGTCDYFELEDGESWPDEPFWNLIRSVGANGSKTLYFLKDPYNYFGHETIEEWIEEVNSAQHEWIIQGDPRSFAILKLAGRGATP